MLRLHMFLHKQQKGSMYMQFDGDNMPRVRVSLTLPQECVDWIDEKIKSRKYATRSHAVEVLVWEAIKKE